MRTLGDAGTLEDGVFETDYASLEPLAGWVLRQNGRAVPLEPDELRVHVREALALARERHEGEPPALAQGEAAPGRRHAGATRAAGGARAVRSSSGAARVPPRGLRREPRGRHSRRRPRRALLDPPRGAPGAPVAAQPRQLRRRLLHRLRGAARRPRARRQGALRRRVPAGAAPDAARGTGDPARARVRRAVHRGRLAHAARPGAPEARGDVWAVRARAVAASKRTRATRSSS